jgi:DNA-binding MarR family transcriptional regulator
MVSRTQGLNDKREKHLALTEKGTALEKRLSMSLKRAIASAYRSAGPEAVQGFREVLLGLIHDDTRKTIETMAKKRR